MKWIKIILVTAAFAGLAGVVTGSPVVAGNSLLRAVAVIASGIVSASVSSAYELIDTHDQGLKTWFLSQFLYRREKIRLSFSYLYRIELDGKYLLVRGNRMKDRYQPIGGVYKFYPEAKDFLNFIDYVSDTKMKNHDETDDLRIQISGKNLLKFYDWFLSMKNREYDPSREFYEEVIQDGTLPEEFFRHLKYRKVKIHNKGITWSEFLGIHEVLYADIFEVTLDDKQKEIIRCAVKEHPEKLCLASADEMRCRRYGDSVEANLGTNVPWLLGE